MPKILTFLIAGLFITSCTWYDDTLSWAPPFDGTGYRPVYLNREDVSKVSTGPGQVLSDPGKIYLLEPYLFINEKGRGIHIIDNSDPGDPKNISFVSIPGNYDMAAKGHWLYTDNYTDLLTFDISDPRDVKLVKRIENAIPINDYPIDVNNVFFECPDPSKGTIVSWEKVDMEAKPKCWR